MLQAKVNERDVEIESWRSMYLKVVGTIQSTNWGLASSVASLKEMASKYEKAPYRLNYYQSKGARRRMKTRIRKAKEGAASYFAR